MRLFHLVAPDAWAAAVAAGEYRPASLAAEGFVHFSFAEQVAGTANLLYRDVAQLIVVEVDAARIDARLVVEDTYGSGVAFPHVYGPIAVSAAVAVHALGRAPDGSWTFTPGDASAPASTDR